MEIIITILILALIIGAFIYHDHTEWSKIVEKAASTQLCPFCGLRLHRFRYEDKDKSYISLTCPACEFCASVEAENSLDTSKPKYVSENLI